MDVDNVTIITQKHQLVPEQRNAPCYQCGRVSQRPLDASALKDVGTIYYALADEVFCCRACLYTAAMDHVPLSRNDVKAAVAKALGPQTSLCYLCTAEIETPVTHYLAPYTLHFCSDRCRTLALSPP